LIFYDMGYVHLQQRCADIGNLHRRIILACNLSFLTHPQILKLAVDPHLQMDASEIHTVSDTSDPGHFRPKTLQTQDILALVPKCP